MSDTLRFHKDAFAMVMRPELTIDRLQAPMVTIYGVAVFLSSRDRFFALLNMPGAE